ncbi:MAG: phage tail tube protein [Burkholderiales bacterium]
MPALSDQTYFIGQGKCYWAPRQTNGPIIGGYQYFGDTQSLQVSSKQKTVEVEENVTGFGGIALHAAVSIPLNFKLQLPVWSMKNLALALFGNNSGSNAGGSVTSESLTVYTDGGMTRLANFGLTAAPTLTTGTGIVTGTTVTAGGAGYTSAPTVAFSAAPAGGVTATGVAVISGGAVTAINLTNPGSGYTAAPTITLTGGGFTTAATATASIASKTLVSGTDFSYDAVYGNVTPLTTSGSFFTSIYPPTTPVPLLASYTYAANNGFINMLTAPSPEVSLQFNGLNVANPSGSTFGAVPVLIKRAKLDFTKMVDLISKKEGILELDGAILYDATATDGVPYGTFAKA